MNDENLEREAAKMIFSASAKSEEVVPAQPQGPEIPFECPFCNEAYLVSEELAGKTIHCRNCREICRVDAKKVRKAAMRRLPFWVGLMVGIGLTVLVVVALKIARII